MRALQTRAPNAVQLITRLEELEAWDDAWRELAEERGNPFVTPEWYRAWFDHYSDEAEPFVIVSGSTDGECQGVLPLVRTRRSRVLRFAGADLGDHFQPACREEDEAAFSRSVSALLRERSDEWSTAVFHGTEIGSSWHTSLCEAAGPLATVTGPATPMPYVDLGGIEWSSFWAARGRKLRKYVRSRTNHMHAQNGHGPTSELVRKQLSSCLRVLDRVWVSDGDFVYLLPECDRNHATGFVRRLAAAVGVELSTTIACFPEDGLTGGLLIELVLGDADMLGEVHASSNGNGSDHGRRRLDLRRLLRRRTRHRGGAIEWTEIAPAPPTGNGNASTNGDPGGNGERASDKQLVTDAQDTAR